MAVSKTTFLRALRSTITPSHPLRQSFHSSPRYAIIKSFPLADIGEGITECQLIQWFVQPGARVQQFDKLCEVQSDKASVEITSPYEGVVTKLHYEPDEMAVTGRSLVDMDVDEEDVVGEGEGVGGGGVGEEVRIEGMDVDVEGKGGAGEWKREGRRESGKQDHSSLATPAVRHLTKSLQVSITDVKGTGKDGRVLKEDVHRHVQSLSASTSQPQPAASQPRPTSSNRTDRTVPLSPIQTQMFRAMTRSLSIPHFLYTTTVDITSLTALRQKLNTSSAAATGEPKLTQLPFILKAVSLAFQHHPLLNTSLHTKGEDGSKPELTYQSAHNFGVAIDTSSGLVVPVIRDVQDLTILEIAGQLKQLSSKARENKLSPSDFSGATFTVSNIGNIGGLVVAPVISAPQVAILGIGRSRIVPAFGPDGGIVKREEVVFSWSADHRVVDGAECARAAERVRGYLEEVGGMVTGMR
ncbi:hypothetical protein LTR97_011680 [Elasticomyces elasticus]|uniref:Dihydrolipoamide acetyltransferase component of pyruvate dehydrogenase complex n=1 Tax=Elasticomyces elasticus TaxID=574655 RepID=A0AAN7ZYD2_9PEZI|nr:hypothetical protein LTR97_011680 [Elasticomyces elasticus]